ncbi:hypothetical protein GPL20_15195 [Bradyrhizobium cajani]|uniref:Uncharacterized protein n=1 Tax=Bradyrhizobium cajani TaxID=1928661 RepID=A0A844T5I2_9BRAD|nr:hypothetical protein [Bradyrhizobium cajani]
MRPSRCRSRSRWRLRVRHCEEPLRRSNPDCFRGNSLDCFASLAMTERGAGCAASPQATSSAPRRSDC